LAVIREKETLYIALTDQFTQIILQNAKLYCFRQKPDHARIPNNRQILVWLPTHCFVNSPIPEISCITMDDEIEDNYNQCVEVSIEFSNEKNRQARSIVIN